MKKTGGTSAYLMTDGDTLKVASSSGTTGNKVSFSLTAPDNAMTLDNSGNLLVGTTALTPGNGNTDTGHLLKNDGRLFASSASNSQFNRNSNGDIVTFRQSGNLVGSIGTVGGDLAIYSTGSSHAGLRFAINAYLPTDNAGAVIDATTDFGTSAYRYKDLYLSGAAYVPDVRSTTNQYFTHQAGNFAAFRDSTGAERMRIDSSGNVLVGGTNSRPAEFNHPKGISFRGDIGQIQASTDANTPMLLNRDTSDGTIAEFRKDGTTVGSIGTSGGDLVVGTGNTGLLFYDATPQIIPRNTTVLM